MTTPTHTPNPHLSDPLLRTFLFPSFSPTDYLNTHLPSVPPQKQLQQHPNPPPTLSATASQTQTHLSTLNALTTRLSATLTTLTDEILRTSSRLAYEVELLRGEALSLADSLSSRGELNESIRNFVPNGLDPASPPRPPPSPTGPRRESVQSPSSPPQASSPTKTTDLPNPEPPSLPRLRTLHHVRSQLQLVIQQFNLALAFPLPPSLLTNPTSSRVSVNPPSTDPELEREGQAALARLRLEIEELLDAGVPERARERVEELREACRIWKGTGEEEARGKWVDGLELLVEERAGGWKGEGGGQMKREGSAVRGIKVAEASSGGGPGFLRRLRDEIYME